MPTPADDDTREIVRNALEQRGQAPTRGDYREVLEKLAEILQRLGKGDIRFELIDHRVRFLERIVFGIGAVVGVTLVGSILALVMRVST